MLAPEERAKNTKGTTRARVKGNSYKLGEVYKSSIHKELGHMEQCYYDARHYIVNSKTRYHCGDCCARISKGSNNIENSGGDPDYCWWCEMEADCPAWHTPMENHHLHGCVDYETKIPKVHRERLRRDLGLDNTGRTSDTATSTAAVSTDHNSSSNTNPTREDADSEPSLVKIQPPTQMTKKPQSPATPPGVPGPTFHHPTNTPTQAKWEQHDSTITTHKITAITSLVKKAEKLNRTNTHNAKKIAKKPNENIGMQIIDDTTKEYEYYYIRMRSYEIRAARKKFNELSVNKFDPHPTESLTEDEMNTINNEMRDETRRKNWL